MTSEEIQTIRALRWYARRAAARIVDWTMENPSSDEYFPCNVDPYCKLVLQEMEKLLFELAEMRGQEKEDCDLHE